MRNYYSYVGHKIFTLLFWRFDIVARWCKFHASRYWIMLYKFQAYASLATVVKLTKLYGLGLVAIDAFLNI